MVTKQSAREDFIHHKWFVTYHLEIVEVIALELCEKYTTADSFKVVVLAWLHDYEKIIDFDNQYNTELLATRELMKRVGFENAFIHDMCSDINLYNAKENLSSASIEIQIVSSSDAASHFVGPFESVYWYENPEKSLEEIQADIRLKVTTDWEKKITLPEIKQAFESRYRYRLEIIGQLPEKYLN